eukprot:2746540-Pleurochrysis_carterae.AAC.1
MWPGVRRACSAVERASRKAGARIGVKEGRGRVHPKLRAIDAEVPSTERVSHQAQRECRTILQPRPQNNKNPRDRPARTAKCKFTLRFPHLEHRRSPRDLRCIKLVCGCTANGIGLSSCRARGARGCARPLLGGGQPPRLARPWRGAHDALGRRVLRAARRAWRRNAREPSVGPFSESSVGPFREISVGPFREASLDPFRSAPFCTIDSAL